MSRLTLRSNFGGVERPIIKDYNIDEEISLKKLHLLLRCEVKDLAQIAMEKGIPQIEGLTKSGKKATFLI